MKRVALLGAALVTCATLSAAPATAITMQALYSGTVSSGFDQSNFLGVGTDLGGLAFTATFIYDPEIATYRDSGNDSGGEWDSAYGGTDIGPGTISPVLSASVKIGVATYTIDSNYYGYNERASSPNSNHYHTRDRVYWNGGKDLGNDSLNVFLLGLFLGTPGNLLSEFTLDSEGVDSSKGYFSSSGGKNTPSRNIYAEADISSLTVSRVSVVPLPAALPMMAAGLGALGLISWRKRRGATQLIVTA